MAKLLPLFPLQLVVFPGGIVPLHIFEERYKEMVGEAEAAGTEFGIVLAKDGGIVNTGCTVKVETVLKRYPDGRFDVLTRGQRRFVVTSLDQEKDYLRGEVEYYGDDEPESAPHELRHRAVAAFTKMSEALAPLAEEANEQAPDPEHPFLSFQLAAAVDDLDFRNLLQRSRSEADRLRAFVDFAGEYAERKQYAAKMKRTAPQNGFGHKSAVN
ncbi:MAG TPA: LON peptidase substrate-binding domain-containing protein [Bryobacteraceae bacterium]|jgi:Lon protease-like protein|nr:LON peptidase substrate-binding domain-containing protein [Bryobacteraceae bacterium]